MRHKLIELATMYRSASRETALDLIRWHIKREVVKDIEWAMGICIAEG